MNPDIEDAQPAEEYHDENEHQDGRRQQIVRKGKLILYNRPANVVLDENTVTMQRYNSFGSNLFPGKDSDLQIIAGVTSPQRGEGKTLVAANLATFFALDVRDDTVLVDLNLRSARVHEIFGVPSGPGIMDSISGTDTIALWRSSIRGLWILPAGANLKGPLTFDRAMELRDVLTTLRRQFRFVVVDLPAALDPEFPGMVGSHLDGYFLVASVGSTKKTHISQAINVLNESKIIGFIMNKVPSKM